MGERRGGWGRRLLVAGLATALLVACTGDDDDVTLTKASTGTTGPKGWKVLGKAPVSPPELDDTPLWGSTNPGALKRVERVTFHGDAAILDGGDGLAVVDAATGKVRWRIPWAGELPGGDGAILYPVNNVIHVSGVPVIDADAGWAVLVGYGPVPSTEPTATEEFGVAALAATDGRVVWKRPVVPAGPQPEGGAVISSIRTVLSDGQTAFVVGEPPGPSVDTDSAEDPQGLKLVAVDGRTGEVRWERVGVELYAVADELLVGFVPGTNGPEPGQLAGMVLDKATGDPLPDRLEGYDWARPRAVAGHYAQMLSGTEPGDAVGTDLLLDLRSGKELGTLGRGTAACTSGDQLIACRIGDDGGGTSRLATFDVEAGTGAVAERSITGQTVTGAWQGGVFVEGEARSGPATSRLLDRAGKEVDEVPGRFVAGSDTYVFMATGTTANPAYAVYRVAG